MRSEELQAIIDTVPRDFADPADDALTVRGKMAPFHGHPLNPDSECWQEQLGQVSVLWLRTPRSRTERTLLFCHGGAFVSCDARAYQFYAERIANELETQVVTVDYRLAPESQYPAAHQDCLEAFRALQQRGLAVGLIGDSCGGGLAVALAQAAAGREMGTPQLVISLCGWLDLEPSASLPEPFINAAWLRLRARDYLGDVPPRDISPMNGSIVGLPPLLLQIGETDVARSSAEQFAARVNAAGGIAQLDIVEGAVHGFQGLDVPEATTGWQHCRQFMARFWNGRGN